MDIACKSVDRVAGLVARRVAGEWRDVYGAVDAMRGRYGYEALTAAELRVFSQNGEDGVIAEIFHRIGTTEETFVEFGVANGRECNTRFLAEVLGWGGTYFESHAGYFAQLSERYRRRPDIQTIPQHLTPQTVNRRFDDAGIATEFDLLSIDVDGQDYWIWRALDRRPRVVVIEFNAALDGQRVEPEGSAHEFAYTDYFGASLGALRSLGDQLGYTLVHVELAAVNAFFVRNDCVGMLGAVRVLERTPNYWLSGTGFPHEDGPYVEV